MTFLYILITYFKEFFLTLFIIENVSIIIFVNIIYFV